MKASQQQKVAKKFAEKWKDKGYEKGHSQIFWYELLRDVYGVDDTFYIKFEERVEGVDSFNFADGIIDETLVLIEQKSIQKDLKAKEKQSDGSDKTPFEQARDYGHKLPHSRNPRWIVICNFKEFHIYDMEHPNEDPKELLLENLDKDYNCLSFLVSKNKIKIKKQTDLSINAGELVGELYDAFLEEANDSTCERTHNNLNILCVRLVFCLYADDAGVFPDKGMFHEYISDYKTHQMSQALEDLFIVLNQRPKKRRLNLNHKLAAFPYVNGGLFEKTDIEIPEFNDKSRKILLEKASLNFDWSGISPTVFGAVFESTLTSKMKSEGGMHYTSIEDIHKVINPLFYNELENEFNEICKGQQKNVKRKNLQELQAKLSTLRFLDPACGSGNFLTETYIRLRRLENEIIRTLHEGQIAFNGNINVSIEQFYGIEKDHFAVNVAKTALWIAESQMLKETENIVHEELQHLPITTEAHIEKENALRMDWNDVISKDKLSYILGNPPFAGHQKRNKEQKEDMVIVYGNEKNFGKLDYVCCWYQKAIDYAKGTAIKLAFVSTNSIAQGESVAIMWKPIFDKGYEISFAYRSFIWKSEAKNKANVYCVIIALAPVCKDSKKYIFERDAIIETDYINGYLLPMYDIDIVSRGRPLTSDMPIMRKGSQHNGKSLILTSKERNELIGKYSITEKWLLKYIGANEFIKNIERYCLWLDGVATDEYSLIKPIMKRLNKVREQRLKSPTKSVRLKADKPMLFEQSRKHEVRCIVIPEVSSENRRYIPIGFLDPGVIASNKLYLIPSDSLYIFGILISSVHMIWMQVVAGRHNMRYSYSPAVYNNFPWPDENARGKEKIVKLAENILSVRDNEFRKNPKTSLNVLYNSLIMPPELTDVHRKLDASVMKLYGFRRDASEAEIMNDLNKKHMALKLKSNTE